MLMKCKWNMEEISKKKGRRLFPVCGRVPDGALGGTSGVVVRCLTKHRFELNQGTYYIFPGRFFRLEIDSFSPAFAGTADAGEVCIS